MKTKIAGLAVLTLAVGLFAGAAVVTAVNGQSPASAATEMPAACTEHMVSMTAMHDMMGGQDMMGGGAMTPPGSPGPEGMGPGHEWHHASPPPDQGFGQ